MFTVVMVAVKIGTFDDAPFSIFTPVYDLYCNYIQTSLYEDENAPQVLWNQVGDDEWDEARTSRFVISLYDRVSSL